MKNGVKNIQAMAYNGACTVIKFKYNFKKVWPHILDMQRRGSINL